jgi:selenocysteine lyase/cysteine desulfurase
MSNLEEYFSEFRENIIGINQEFTSKFGTQKIIYTDWTASGRLYKPIEDLIANEIGPFVANTHTETNTTGKSMTIAYKKAKEIIKKHINANDNDVLINYGTGMTAAINKLQRILKLKDTSNTNKPIVFVSHMEHHSNQTSWLETICDVEIIPDVDGLFSIDNLKVLLEKYKDRDIKIASVTACSNVTGIKNPYHEIAKLMHRNRGLCFVDFACSAPYININMHPDHESHLDAIFFSPHKFLGGPGTSGVLVFNKKLYNNSVPDNPGGGTVKWTNPWEDHLYLDDIEDREDGGTPGFLQVIRTALAIQLKEKMGVDNIVNREKELTKLVFDKLSNIKTLTILEEKHKDRLPIFSFVIEGLHFNLAVKILNDLFGIQTRGGCSCAGTYGHKLLNISKEESKSIINLIETNQSYTRPGWIRLSLHPTTTNSEVEYVCNSIICLVDSHKELSKLYKYNEKSNDFYIEGDDNENDIVNSWFT